MNGPPVADWLTIVVAGYAAIVATGALALEIRRWVESGARLIIDPWPQAQTIGIPDAEGKTFLYVNVMNRGNAPTTVRNFVIGDYGNWFRRIFSKPSWSVIVINSHVHSQAPQLPEVLQPGEIWTGMTEYDDEGELYRRVRGGLVYVMIYASHSDKPTEKRVRLGATLPKNAKESSAE